MNSQHLSPVSTQLLSRGDAQLVGQLPSHEKNEANAEGGKRERQ